MNIKQVHFAYYSQRLKGKPVLRKIWPSSCSSVQRARKSSGASDQLSTHLACCLLGQPRDPLGPLAHPHRHLRHLLLLLSHFRQRVQGSGVCLVAAGEVAALVATGRRRWPCLVPCALTGHQPAPTTDQRRASRKLVVRKSSQEMQPEDHLWQG